MYKKCFPSAGWTVLKKLGSLHEQHSAVLAGGTALALQIGHRISYDLDFFTSQAFTSEQIIRKIQATGLEYQVLSESEGTFLAEINGVKFSIFNYPYPWVENPIKIGSFQMANLLDIAVMKLIAISQRGTKRDFVDLYFILQSLPFHLIASALVKKFGRKRINPIHIGKALVYFSDAEADPEPRYASKKSLPWKKIKLYFNQHCKQLTLDLRSACHES